MKTPQSPALYARISSDLKDTKKGVERQQRIMTRRALDLGWGTPVVYMDNDRSSKAGVERSDFNRMLADLESGVRDGLLVYKLDRYSRETHHTDHLKRLDIPVATEYREFDPGTSDGMKALRDEASSAEYETAKLSERMRAQREQSAQDGMRHGARAFGWGVRSKKGNWKKRNRINPEEATIVREGIQRVLTGESLVSVMRDWNAREIKTSRGATWTSASLRSLLERWSNAGVRQHQGHPLFGVETEWEPIVDLETLQRVRARLANNPRNTTTTRARKHLLSGVLTCACGSRMRAQYIPSGRPKPDHPRDEHGNKVATHYKCQGDGCGRSVPYQGANEMILKWVGHYLMWLPENAFLPDEVQAEVDKLISDLSRLDERREKVLNSDIEEDDRLELLSRLKKDRNRIRAVLDSHASSSALNALVASLRPIREGHRVSIDQAAENSAEIRSRFLGLDLKTQKDLLQQLATFTVHSGFSPYDPETGKRRKLKADERIEITPLKIG